MIHFKLLASTVLLWVFLVSLVPTGSIAPDIIRLFGVNIAKAHDGLDPSSSNLQPKEVHLGVENLDEEKDNNSELKNKIIDTVIDFASNYYYKPNEDIKKDKFQWTDLASIHDKDRILLKRLQNVNKNYAWLKGISNNNEMEITFQRKHSNWRDGLKARVPGTTPQSGEFDHVVIGRWRNSGNPVYMKELLGVLRAPLNLGPNGKLNTNLVKDGKIKPLSTS